MTKVLAYCAFLHRNPTTLPEFGVSGAPVREINHGGLRLLWSEVQWPFAESALQRSAVQFHQVVSHMFAQGGVVPFRLLSVFDDRKSLADFVVAHEAGFVADLERLHDLVQMECVLYPAPERGAGASGKDYLRDRAAALRRAEDFVQRLAAAMGPMSRGMRVRESSKGSRIFILVERGNELKFHSIVQEIPVPEQLSRRTSGPWPPAEFLSDGVKMPQIAR